MPVQPNLLERTAFYTLNQAPGVMLDLAGALSYKTLSTALELGVFEALAERPSSAGELAATLNAQPQAIDALLQALVAIGYVDTVNGYFTNSTLTRKWLIDNEAFNGRAIMRFWDDTLNQIWPTAADVIRTGRRPFDTYEWIERDPERNRSFQQTLVVTALTAGHDIAARIPLTETATRILDVGGGHGLFSILLCQQHPNVRATIIERPAALEVAAEYAQAYGMSDRIELVAGDLWEVAWGRDYDAVLLFNLLHHFDLVANSSLLRKAATALKPGGLVAILDQVAGTVSGSATNALIRLIALQYYIMADGRVFTEDELETSLEHTGFRDTRTHRLSKLPGTSLMTAVKR